MLPTLQQGMRWHLFAPLDRIVMDEADLWCHSHVDGPCDVLPYIPARIQGHEHSDTLTAKPVFIEPAMMTATASGSRNTII